MERTIASPQTGAEYKVTLRSTWAYMFHAAESYLANLAQKVRAGAVAKIINDLMPFIPLNVIVSTEPWNESILAGAPEEGDPLLQNPSTDHFVILGTILHRGHFDSGRWCGPGGQRQAASGGCEQDFCDYGLSHGSAPGLAGRGVAVRW